MATNYEPAAQSYILNRIFHFPTDNGSALAVAVSATNASSILSIYSILVNTAVGQVWAIVVIVGVYATLRQPAESRSHNAVVASVGVLNAKRPLEVGALVSNYLWKLKRKSPCSMMLWLFVSIFALIASAGVPALIGRSMVLGHAAPVNPDSIYVPGSDNIKPELSFALNTLAIPATLRAAGSVQSTDISIFGKHVQIEDPVKLKDRPDINEGEFTSQYRYRYQVTAKDFGLQKYHDLALRVEGSCTTEYGWRDKTSNKDQYNIWSNKSYHVNLERFESPMPIALFVQKQEPTIHDESHLNTSFAIVISSSGRTSFSQGKDPFYFTGANHSTSENGIPTYQVLSGRPVLSCWQTDSWMYKDQHYSVDKLSSQNSTLNDFPESLASVFSWFLGAPKVVSLGTRLGQSALASATRSSVGSTFDAGGANIQADLTHLVLASYIETKNTLSDTTVFSRDIRSDKSMPKVLEEDDLKDVAIFVLYSKDISALSLSVLIAVPIVVVIMFIIAYFMTTHPLFPWHVVQGYQATVLYSLLDERVSEANGNTSEDVEDGHSHKQGTWKRVKSIAWLEEPHYSGRHASIVKGADGKPTLIVAESKGTSMHGEIPEDRNSDIPLLIRQHEGATEIRGSAAPGGTTVQRDNDISMIRMRREGDSEIRAT